jgi:hypothetical protein
MSEFITSFSNAALWRHAEFRCPPLYKIVSRPIGAAVELALPWYTPTSDPRYL